MTGGWTKGVWAVTNHKLRKVTSQGVLICNAVLRNSGTSKNPPSCKDQLEAEANAALIAEAGTVANETGLTPRQLAKQNNVMLVVLRGLAEHDFGANGDRVTYDALCKSARAVIAKCTGAE